MTRKMFFWTILISLLVLAGMASAADMVRMMPIPAKQAILTGDEPMPEAPYYPSSGRSICAAFDTCGFTQYDYQSNGSSGHRIAVDSQGNIHVAWMKGLTNNTTRHVFFNCKSTSGWSSPGTGSQVDYQTTGSGYNQISVTNDDRSAVAYHRSTTNQESLYVAIDAFTCLSSFSYMHPPNRLTSPSRIIMWPYLTIDRSGKIHVTAEHNAALGAPQAIGYTRSTDGGATWSTLSIVDSCEVIGTIVVSSRVSDKVAIIFMHSTDTTSQWKNDVVYVQSLDGTTWDFRNGKVNVTHYGQGGDSSFAYTDLAALYDYNDDLHIIWNSQYVTTGIYYSAKMNHYDVSSGVITEFAQFDSTWPSAGCDFGVWNWAYAKMSLAVDTRNDLYATYTSWDTSDCSAGGFANGDIYLQYSTDGGASWTDKVNVTDSHTPGCNPGECDSDHWSSMAEKADTAVHIFFVNDRDPGGIPQTEGALTNNPMIYKSYSTNLPLLGIEDDVQAPKLFTLAQNYPNPFNAKTNIGFDLTKTSQVDLSVYDITGAKVATLYKGNLEAGAHQINWDASQVASGVYYYTLKADGKEVTKKMTLLK